MRGVGARSLEVFQRAVLDFDGVSVELEFQPLLSYALVHNGVPPVRLLSVNRKPVFNLLNREHESFARSLGFRMAAASWATSRHPLFSK
jgi:hypothetical protein